MRSSKRQSQYNVDKTAWLCLDLIPSHTTADTARLYRAVAYPTIKAT